MNNPTYSPGFIGWEWIETTILTRVIFIMIILPALLVGSGLKHYNNISKKQ